MIEEEMKHAIEDHPLGSFLTVDAVASINEMTAQASPEEVLQTRILGGTPKL